MKDFNTHIRDLCPELRIKIFAECLVQPIGRRVTSSPALLAALRPDDKLYEEALETYYKINRFKLDPKNPRPYLSLKDDRVLQLRKLIICAYTIPSERFTVHPRISSARNLEYLMILARVPHYIWLEPVAPVVAAAKNFTRLKELILYLDTDPKRAKGLLDVNPSGRQDKSARATVSFVENEMGIKLEEVDFEDDGTVFRSHRTFVWEANKRKVITQ